MRRAAAVSEGGGIALVVFGAACFGAIPIAVSVAQREGLPLITTLAWRYGIGAALLVALAGAGWRALVARTAVGPVLVLGIMQALVAGVSLSALRYIPAATLSFLFYTYPAWIAVIAAARRIDRLTMPRIVALALALIGITIMVGAPGGSDLHPAGIALALGSALLYALYVPIMHHYERQHGAGVVATWVAGGAALAFVAGAVLAPGFTGPLGVPATVPGWLAVVALGVLSTAVGFVVFLRGLGVVGPVRAAIVSTVEPFITAMLAALVLGQPFTPATLAGGACVAAAVILLQLAQRTRRRQPHTMDN